MSSDMMTIKEISEYLKIKEKTAYHLAAKGEIPGFKVGGAWRFDKADILKWIEKQKKAAK
jgi:excisionase family DNA binding protein